MNNKNDLNIIKEKIENRNFSYIDLSILFSEKLINDILSKNNKLEENLNYCLEKNFTEKEKHAYGFRKGIFTNNSIHIRKYFENYFFNKYKLITQSNKNKLNIALFAATPSLVPDGLINIKMLKKEKDLNEYERNIYKILISVFKEPKKHINKE